MPAATSTVLESRVTAVTVYRGWARVEREASLPANGAPPVRVTLPGLPLALDDATVQARVEPTDGGGAVPVATDLRVGLDAPPPTAAAPSELDAALRAAARAEERLQHRLSRVQEERSWFEGLALPARPAGADGQAPPPSPLAARRALLAFQHAQVERLVAEEHALAGRLKAAEAARERAEHALAEAGSAATVRPDALHKHVQVGLAVHGAGATGPARLVVSYLVPGVQWAPTYRLQLDPGMTRARLALRAAVCQQTGEDWTEVRLTLSTADALRFAELPKLASVRIGRRQLPPAPKGWREPPQGAEALYHDHDRAFGGPSAPPTPPSPDEVSALAETERWKDARAPEDDAFDRESAPEPVAEYPAEQAEARRDLARIVSKSAPPPPAPPRAAAPMGVLRQEAPAKPGARSLDLGAGGAVDEDAAFGAEAFDDVIAAPDATVEPPGPLGAPGALLDYGALRLDAPSHTTRGRLQPAGALVRYLEALPEFARPHAAALWQAMARAQAAAQRVTQLALPPGCDGSLAIDEFDHAYAADAPVSLPADGQFHTIPLAVREGDSAQHYVVVPRESADVFRFVEWRNPLEAPLLRGPVDVALGGDYLLTTSLGPVPARGTARLGLGVEQAIVVARNTRYHEDTTGMLRGTLSLHHAIAIEVRNNLARPARLEVRERIPVTPEDHDDVTVAQGEVTPPWEPYDPDDHALRGGARWIVTVPPGATQALAAAYTVRISAKHELAGGNRREV